MAWYSDHLVLRDFSDAMAECGVVEDSKEVLVRPYRFDAEFQVWKSFGMPNAEDDNWDDFVEGLNSAGEEESEDSE